MSKVQPKSKIGKLKSATDSRPVRCCSFKALNEQKIYVKTRIGRIFGIIDTGATINLSGISLIKRLGIDCPSLLFDPQVYAVNGKKLNIIGMVALNAKLGQDQNWVFVYISDDIPSDLILWGKPFLQKWGISIDFSKGELRWRNHDGFNLENNSVKVVSYLDKPKNMLLDDLWTGDEKADNLIEKYSSIFSDVPGRVKGYSCKIIVKPDFHPVAQGLYRQSPEKRDIIKDEIQK